MSDPRGPETITKKELVNRIADETGQTKVVVKEIVQLFLDEIVDELSVGNRLEFREFGVFEVRRRAARRAQNPRTLEKVHVPSKRVVKFKVGRSLRERVCDAPDREEELQLQRALEAQAAQKDGSSSPPGTPGGPNSPF